jgi:hypothetical protein
VVLFKPKALPVVIADITNSIHRASANSATAVSLLHELVRRDPPDINLDALVTALSRDVFRLREDYYPANEIRRLLDPPGAEIQKERRVTHWAVYAYLFSLLPALVEQPRVGGSRWTADEYHQLEVACFSHWCNAPNQNNGTAIMADYNRVRAATRAWLWRSSKLASAVESCASATIDHILDSFPRQDGSVREKGFRFAVEELIDSLYATFKTDLAGFYLGAGGYGFLASDPAPLPPWIKR